MLSLYKLVVASTLALSAAAKTIRVDVGKGGKIFTPNTLEAAKGDLLEFHFFAVNHSVVQGRFDKPCQPAQNKPIFSGFQGPIAAGQEGPRVFQVTVNDTDPLVFYCSQNVGFHCASGMFAVVNGGARPSNLDGYKAQISGNLTAVTPPGGPSGGVFSVQSNVSNTTTTTTTGSGSGSGSPTATLATTATNTDVQTTAAPTGSASGSAAGGSGAPQTTSTKPAAGANVRASFGGLVGAALFAGLMM